MVRPMKAAAIIFCALVTTAVGASGFWAVSKRSMQETATAWFHVTGPVQDFTIGVRCKAGVFPVERPDPRDALTVYGEFTWANRAFNGRGLTSVQIAGYSPKDLPEVLSLGGETPLFRQLNAAFGRIAPCGAGIGVPFERAFEQPGATLVFRGQDSLIMILDPSQMQLFVLQANFV